MLREVHLSRDGEYDIVCVKEGMTPNSVLYVAHCVGAIFSCLLTAQRVEIPSMPKIVSGAADGLARDDRN